MISLYLSGFCISAFQSLGGFSASMESNEGKDALMGSTSRNNFEWDSIK